jgi:hypothetical protein
MLFARTNRQMYGGKMDEKTMTHLEEHIPELAQAAVTQAYWAALARGYSVLERTDEGLVETFPDGSYTLIKPLEPLLSVPKGTKRFIP